MKRKTSSLWSGNCGIISNKIIQYPFYHRFIPGQIVLFLTGRDFVVLLKCITQS